MTEKAQTLTDKTIRKLKFAAGAGTPTGGALGTIVVYLIETLTHVDLPQSVEAAIVTLAAALMVWAIGYRTHPAKEDQVMT